MLAPYNITTLLLLTLRTPFCVQEEKSLARREGLDRRLCCNIAFPKKKVA